MKFFFFFFGGVGSGKKVQKKGSLPTTDAFVVVTAPHHAEVSLRGAHLGSSQAEEFLLAFVGARTLAAQANLVAVIAGTDTDLLVATVTLANAATTKLVASEHVCVRECAVDLLCE